MKGLLQIKDLGLPGAPSSREENATPRPRPLNFWRQYLEDHNGCVSGVGGERVPVDLSPWADADERTLLAIWVQWVDPALVGTKDPNPRSK